MRFICKGVVKLPFTFTIEAGSLSDAVRIAENKVDDLQASTLKHLKSEAPNLGQFLHSEGSGELTSVDTSK